MLAVEHRFKTAVLGGGGLWLEKTLPEVGPVNFVGRVHIPVLMVNGRYNHVYALETSQKWLFELLGTPVEWKKHIVYDSGHAPPRREFIRDSLEWLDATLGPVRR